MTLVAALRGGPFHGERRDLADFTAREAGVVDPEFPPYLTLDVDRYEIPRYGFKAEVTPGGTFLYELRAHESDVGLYVCDRPGMTPRDMHRRAKALDATWEFKDAGRLSQTVTLS